MHPRQIIIRDRLGAFTHLDAEFSVFPFRCAVLYTNTCAERVERREMRMPQRYTIVSERSGL